VASFVGTLNQLQATVVDVLGGTVRVGDQMLTSSNPMTDLVAGQSCVLAIRPEALLIETPQEGKNAITVVVEEVSFLGAVVRIRTRLGSEVLDLDVFNDPNQTLPERGTRVALGLSFENLLILR
jgi:putative spermidine/putrescine transport system ATP-binding protein